jgi:hypothetical protein
LTLSCFQHLGPHHNRRQELEAKTKEEEEMAARVEERVRARVDEAMASPEVQNQIAARLKEERAQLEQKVWFLFLPIGWHYLYIVPFICGTCLTDTHVVWLKVGL